MLLKGVAVDEKVVEVSGNECIQEFAESIIDIALEQTRGIAEIKGHDKIFEEPISSIEGYFPFISRFDMKLIECGNDVNFSEVLSFYQVVKGFSYQRQQVAILQRDIIQFAVINAELESPIVFSCEKYRGDSG